MEAQLFDRISDHLKSEHLQGQEPRLEDRVFQLFKGAGVADEIAKLPEKRFDIVIDGVVALWKIDVMGKNIEQEDQAKIRGSEKSPQHVNETVQKQVKGELDEIGHSYHGFNEWLPGSVKQLIGAALETDPERMHSHKEGIVFGPDHYITRLGRAGEFYSSVISGVYPSGERASMDSYITNERDESVHQMRVTFNTRLGGVVAALQPLPQESKK